MPPHGERGLVAGVVRRRAGDRCHRPRRAHRRQPSAGDAALVHQLEYELKTHQGGSAADHRGPQSGERRADVGQRGAPVEQRGAGNLEGRAAIAERGAHHRQHAAGEQDRGAGGDQQRPRQPADQHQHRDALSRHAAAHPALHAGRHAALQPDPVGHRPPDRRHRAEVHRPRSPVRRRGGPRSSRSRRRRKCKPTTAAGTSGRSSPTARATTGPKAW